VLCLIVRAYFKFKSIWIFKWHAWRNEKLTMHHIVTSFMLLLLHVGDGEDRTRRINRPRPEANQQLVHQPEETALEAVRGHAIRDDGRFPPAERRRHLHGRAVHG
jgi:hypothetical protein